MLNAYFFDSKLQNGVEDRTYSASDFSKYLGAFVTDGILFDVETSFQVTKDNRNNYIIAPGKAYMGGRLITNDTNYTIPIRRADAINSRCDAVVLVLDLATRTTRIEVKNFNSESLVRVNNSASETVREFCLATAIVDKGTTNIAASNLKDKRRDPNLCGVADSIFQRLQFKDVIRDICYPVGSIYTSLQNTNPSTFIGGTWRQIAQGRCLMGAGSIESNTTSSYGSVRSGEFSVLAAQKGGEVKHTLSTSELPNHYHYVARWTGSGGNRDLSESGTLGGWARSGESNLPYALRNADQTGGANVGRSSDTGAGSSHNNIPPYLGVYIWERTA